MPVTIEFYLDFSSSYSYIGQHQLDQLSQEVQLEVQWKPIALGAIFKQRGHAPDGLDTAKGAYIKRDVERSAAERKLPYKWPTPFPFNSINAARIFHYLAASNTAQAVEWGRAVFSASFAEGRDCSDTAVLAELGASLGHDGDSLIAATADPDIKKTLIVVTNEAAERGVFGAPTFFVNGEMYWGADRIDQIRRRLAS